MKKARQIEIPQDRDLTWEEYFDYSEHAMKSSSWYATNYNRNSQQIRDKLYAKGYPQGEITVKLKNGETLIKNMVEDTIDRLTESLLIDDRQYATSIIRIQIDRGNGISKVRSALMQKGVDRELTDELLQELDLDDKISEAVDKAAQRVLRSSAYLKQPEGWARQQRLTQQLLSKGFSFDDISRWKENQDLDD